MAKHLLSEQGVQQTNKQGAAFSGRWDHPRQSPSVLQSVRALAIDRSDDSFLDSNKG
jgi:hypothetical protein